MQKITPCLWFDDQGEEAARYYVDIFRDGEIGKVARYTEAGPGKAGTAMTVTFKLFGQDFMIINGGPLFQFTPATSFVVDCADQEEVDRYWDALSDGGKPGQCGWIDDRFGLSWQIVPAALGRLMSDPDAAKVKRVTEVMLGMGKLVVSELEAASAG